MGTFTEQQHSRLLAGLGELYALAPIEEFPMKVLDLMQRLIGCDGASYNEVEITTGRFRAFVDPLEMAEHPAASAFGAYVHQHPVISHFASTGDAQAHTISDFLSTTAFHRLGLYGEFFGPLGLEDQLSTSLVTDPGERVIGVALNRAGHFAEVDRDLLDAVRPHLVIAYGNAVRYSALLAGASHTPNAEAALERLTERQRDVLRLISAGCSTFEVAQELAIRTATVRKHLEHIFTRLHVESRLAAAHIYVGTRPVRSTDPAWHFVGDSDRLQGQPSL